MRNETALEWLENELKKLEKTIKVHHSIYLMIDKAKRIEMQQIVDAYTQGRSDAKQDGWPNG